MGKIINFILGTNPSAQQPTNSHHVSAYKKAQRERELMRQESKIGATLFGPIPSGHMRDFFCLDEYVWVWDEQWLDESTKTMQQMQIRYEFQPRGVLKTVNGVARGYVEGPELKNLLTAVKTYHDRVNTEIYQPILQNA